MNELFYCIYKRSDYRTMMFTIIARCLVNKKGEFRSQKLKVLPGKGIKGHEKQILNKVYLNKESQYHLSDFNNFLDEQISKLKAQKYLRLTILTTLVNTRKFRLEINQALGKGEFCSEIVQFIDTGDLKWLIHLEPRISRIILPVYRSPKTIPGQGGTDLFQRDCQDIQQEARENRTGFFRHWK